MIGQLNPARNSWESFEAYQARRKKENKKVRDHLRGRWFFFSRGVNDFKGKTYRRDA